MAKPIQTRKEEPLLVQGLTSDYIAEAQGQMTASASLAGGNGSRTFVDFDNNISVKSDFGRQDFDAFRTQNTSNLTPQELFSIADKAYEKVSIVRNIMDTISDFACQGVDVVHRDRQKNLFIKEWFRRVRGPFVSERFCSMAERHANIPIQAAYATLSVPVEEDMTRALAAFNEIVVNKEVQAKRSIPFQYTFLHPSSIEIIGGNAAVFIGKPTYALKIDKSIRAEMVKLNRLGKEGLYGKHIAIIDAELSKAKGNLLPLDPNRFEMYHYKKDDWQAWATPIVKCILDDLIQLDRLKLADSAALDGAISNIRHWTVGIIDPSNPANSIMPTKAGINKIKQILANNVGGGTMDLVTGPELAFKESNSQVHKFLGPEKYKTVFDCIYDGLGVPAALRSSGGSTANNNYVSIKTLIERLRYIRNMLVEFWTKQLIIIQKALGWKYPANIVFDELILSDETLEKKLLLDLCDREIISEDAVREYFGYIPEIERGKLLKQTKSRKAGKLPPKASPYHNPQVEEDMQKLALSSGDVTPSQVGVKLQPKKAGEKTRTDLMDKQKTLQIKENTKVKMKMAAGRPKGVKEKAKRKPKPATKRTSKADQILMWAQSSYSKIADILLPALLNSYGKKNVRQLTDLEYKELEEIKFNTLCLLEPFSEINQNSVAACLAVENSVSTDIMSEFNKLMADFVAANGKDPNTEEKRFMQVIAYSAVKSNLGV
jgi:hypothetical protein